MKKLLHFILLVFILIIDDFTSYAQDFPTIIPPSPTAAGFQKYVEYSKLNHSTGSVSATIPIYTINLQGYSLPLDINYVSNGLRVTDRSGWVGYGWSFSGSCMVTRTVIGFPDEGNTNFVSYYTTIKEILKLENANLLHYASSNIIRNDECRRVKFFFSNLNRYDSEPDIYTYCTPTCSGQFYIDPDFKVIQTSYSQVNIVPNFDSDNSILSFNITDEFGNVYHMSKAESTRVYSPSSNVDYEYKSSWYVSRIKTNRGDDIEYKYIDNSTLLRVNYNSMRTDNCDVFISNDVNDDDKFPFGRFSMTDSYTEISCSPLRLKEIIFPEGRVSFQDEKNSASVNSDYRLKDINIFGNDNDISFLKKITFSYTDIGKESFLKEIITFDSKSKPQLIYNLRYYDGFPVGDIIKSQDKWGFYNAAPNSSLIPDIQKNGNIIYKGANREVAENKAIAGMLKSITFPSGGCTEYIYEQNRYRGNDDLLISNMFTVLIPGQIVEENGLISVIPDLAPNQLIKSFDLDKECVVTFTISTSKKEDQLVNNDDYYLDILSSEDFSVIYKLDKFENRKVTIRLKPGKYSVLMNTDIEPSKMSLAVEYNKRVEKDIFAGGIRLKQIKHRTQENKITVNKIYSYCLKSDESISSGYLLSRSSFYSRFIKRWFYFYTVYGNHPVLATFKRYSSTSFNYQSSTPVAYSSIKESNIDTGCETDGYVWYKYNQVFDKINSLAEYLPANAKYESRQVLRSSPILVEKYDKNNTLVQRVINRYDYFKVGEYAYEQNNFLNEKINNIIYGLRYQTNVYNDFDNSSDIEPYEYLFHFYSESSEIFSLQSREQIDYINRGKDSVVTKTSYKYLDPNNINSKQEKKISGLDCSIINKYYCTKNSFGFNQSLVNSLTGFYGYIHRVESIINGSKEGSSFFKYNHNNGFLLTEKRDSINNSLIKKTNILYNNRNRIITTEVSNGETLSYLYAYNNTIPVAKIENSTYQEVENILGKDVINLIALSSDIEFINSKMRELRADSRMKNAQITSYTHKPLVGVTSITDPNGVTTYYEYDDFGRLNYVVDANRNIINSNSYQYHGQVVVEDSYNHSSITASAIGDGTISPSGIVKVPMGSSKTFTATPSATTKVKRILVNGEEVLNNTVSEEFNFKPFSNADNKSYTINNVSANATVTAEFEPRKYVINVSNSGITGENNVASQVTYADHGSNRSFFFPTKIGYDFIGIKINGLLVTDERIYNMTNINKDITVVGEYREFSFNSLSVNPAKLSVDDTGGSYSFSIVTCGNWTVTNSTSSSWIAINKTSGNGNDNIIVNISALRIGCRTATLEVKVGATTRLITISQEADNNGLLQPNPINVTNPNNTIVSIPNPKGD